MRLDSASIARAMEAARRDGLAKAEQHRLTEEACRRIREIQDMIVATAESHLERMRTLRRRAEANLGEAETALRNAEARMMRERHKADAAWKAERACNALADALYAESEACETAAKSCENQADEAERRHKGAGSGLREQAAALRAQASVTLGKAAQAREAAEGFAALAREHEELFRMSRMAVAAAKERRDRASAALTRAKDDVTSAEHRLAEAKETRQRECDRAEAEVRRSAEMLGRAEAAIRSAAERLQQALDLLHLY